MLESPKALGLHVEDESKPKESAEDQKESVQNMPAPFTKLTRNILNYLSSSKKSLDDFYVKKVGMTIIEETKSKTIYGFNL